MKELELVGDFAASVREFSSTSPVETGYWDEQGRCKGYPIRRPTIAAMCVIGVVLQRQFRAAYYNSRSFPVTWNKLEWRLPVTENPATGTTETWELGNVTADAHPIHIHEVVFEVVNRQDIVVFEDQKQVQINAASPPTPPEP